MNVKLAVQIFSQSVADALKILSHTLKYPGFEKCDAIIEFIELFNRLFDVFNTRSFKGSTNFQVALNKRNSSEVFKFLAEVEIYIKNLKLSDDQPILNSNRKVGFLGFLISIESLRNMYRMYVEESEILLYLPTYKLSQDHLEIFFGKIRSFGRCNNNPTAQQFKAAFLRLLVHVEVKGKLSGNCLPLEEMNILHCSSAIKSINQTTPTDAFDEEDPDEGEDLNLGILTELNTYNELVVTYIGGFVTKKLEKSIKCQHCIDVLVADTEDSINLHKYELITVKTRGGLKYPSKEIIFICELTEKFIQAANLKSFAFLGENNVKKRLKLKVINEINENGGIFNDNYEFQHHLLQSYDDSDPLNNHYIHLINAAIDMYFKVRYCHFIKQQNNTDTNRNVFNKLILFKGC